MLLSLKNVRASLARLISPPNLPVVGTPPIQLVSPPAPVATGGPGQVIRGNPPELNDVIERVGQMNVRDFMAAQSSLRASIATRPNAARPGRAAPARPAPRAAAPASTDDDVPQPDTELDSAIKSILESVEKLKLMLPADVDADDGEVTQAKAYLAIGNKKEALACISRAHTAVGAQVEAQKSRTALRAMPSSRERAAKLTASGFNEMPAVAALNSLLGRGGPSLKSRSEMVLAPVGGKRTPAPATASPSDYRARVHAIRAEIESLNVQMHKTGIYGNETIAKQSRLTAELNRLIAANRPHRQ